LLKTRKENIIKGVTIEEIIVAFGILSAPTEFIKNELELIIKISIKN
jgi:hypothetical protein